MIYNYRALIVGNLNNKDRINQVYRGVEAQQFRKKLHLGVCVGDAGAAGDVVHTMHR